MTDIRDGIKGALDDCILDIRQRHVAAGQRASGRGMASLESRVEGAPDGYVGQVWGLPYVGAWETGRGPARRAGTSQEQIAFVASLAEWCRIRGFPASSLSDEQYIRTARWLRWRINKFGTELYRSGGRRDIITPAVEALGRRLDELLSVYYESEIENNFFNGGKI